MTPKEFRLKLRSKYAVKNSIKTWGGLKYLYGDDDNCQKEVEIFFPVNLLGDRSERGHYQQIVSKGGFEKVGMHEYVEGDIAEILVTGGDARIALADNADSPLTTGYLAKDGVRVTINWKELGDITKKVVVVTNLSLTASVDLIFNNIYAKKG